MLAAGPGATATVSIVVEPADTALRSFADRAASVVAGARSGPLDASVGRIQPVYGTAAMVRDMEYAARLVLLPLLEPGEEGVGAEVWCRHEAPVAVGVTVTLVATATSQSARRLECDLVARVADAVVGHGRVVQVLVTPDRWLERARRAGSPTGARSRQRADPPAGKDAS